MYGKPPVQSYTMILVLPTIAIQLLLKDIYNKDVSVFLMFAYDPVGNTPVDVCNEYLDKLTTSNKNTNQIF